MNIFKTGVLLAAVCFVSLPALAQEKAKEDPIEKELQLSDDQKAKIADIRKDLSTKQKALIDQIKVKRDALKAELDKDKLDRAAVDAVLKDLKGLQGQVMDNRVNYAFSMREILTLDQYKKLRTIQRTPSIPVGTEVEEVPAAKEKPSK